MISLTKQNDKSKKNVILDVFVIQILQGSQILLCHILTHLISFLSLSKHDNQHKLQIVNNFSKQQTFSG